MHKYHANDDRTILQKAMDLRTTQNLETAHKGKPGTSFNVLENSYLHDISSKVNITLGTNDHDAFQNIDALKMLKKINVTLS